MNNDIEEARFERGTRIGIAAIGICGVLGLLTWAAVAVYLLGKL